MARLHESEIRLSEIIWRIIKLRVSLLIVSVIILVVVWFSLLKGNYEARTIDDNFCEYLVNQNNALQTELTDVANKGLAKTPKIKKFSPLIQSSDALCHQGPSRTWIEASRNTEQTMPLDVTPDLAKYTETIRSAFSDYDARRYAAYDLQIQLSSSYSSSTITVNTLGIARVVPVFGLIVLAVVIILGFQQSSCRRQLHSLLTTSRADDLPLLMAETQFLSGSLERKTNHPERYFEVSPVGLAIGGLYIANIAELLGITSTFMLALVHLTDSIIFSYTFSIYASLFIFTWLLITTRRSYLRRDYQHGLLRDEVRNFSPFWRWPTIVVAIIAIASLALIWATNSIDSYTYFRGVEFLHSQQPNGQLFNYLTYDLSPLAFRDARIQVTVAVVFVLICIVDVALHTRRRWFVQFINGARKCLAGCTLILSTYYLIYMAFLQYEAKYHVPWMDQLSYQGTAYAKGDPMIFYDPALGFWIFLACCAFLMWLSFVKQSRFPNIPFGQFVRARTTKWWRARTTTTESISSK